MGHRARGHDENASGGTDWLAGDWPLPPIALAVSILLLAAHAGAVYSPDVQTSRLRHVNPHANRVIQKVTPNQALQAVPYVPGRLLVKLRSTVQTCVDCLFAQQQPLAPALGSALFDDLNRRYGLRGIRPLRQTDAAVPSLAERQRSQSLRQQQMAATATARTGRPPATALLSDFTSTYVFELSTWFDMEEVAREYARDPAVVYAEPDRKVSVLLTPNDPYFHSSGSWHQAFDDLWGIKLISAPAAWDVTAGEGVVVAVTDTGVDTAHPDITANMWTNPGEIPGNGIDDDGNGFIDDVNGWNFVAGSNNVFDDFGHGTHVAGTIAAVGQNGIGVIGVAFHSKIMALKGLDAGGGGLISDLANAILYAAENHANVINASWGGVGTSQTLDDAIATAAAAGVVFVAAAGNSNSDVNAAPPWGPFIPAANPHAITVAAFDHTDQKAFFSNYGPKIDVAAPGGGDSGSGFDPFRSVLSLLSRGAVADMTGSGRLIVGGNYVRQAGTSMAAPHVAGAAALVLAAHPSYSPAQVRQALRAGADDVDAPGYDFNAGNGRINVARSVSLTALGAEITDPTNGFVATGTTIPISGTAAGNGLASYTLEYGSGQLPTAWTVFAGPLTTPVANGDLGSWDISQVADGQYAIRIRAQDTSGAVFEDRVLVTLDHVELAEPEAGVIIRPSGPLEIYGSAGGGGFQNFRVEWRITTPDYVTGAWRADGMTLAGGGTSPISNGLLATFDTGLITGNADVDLRLVVTQAGGVEGSKEVHHVILDPTLHAGWPQKISGLPIVIETLLNHLTIADLDGDGTKEILVAFGDMVYAFRHDGTQLPGWPQQLTSTVDAGRTVFVERSPAAADLDGDGHLEVVVGAAFEYDSQGRYNGATYVLHADGTPMSGWPKYLTDNYGNGSRGDYVLADVDGDGRREIIGVIGGSIAVMDANGNMLPGWPTPATCAGWYAHCVESLVAVGDVNGDGKKEIAAVTLSPRSDNAQVLALYSSTGVLMPGFPRPLPGLLYGFGAWAGLYPFEQLGDEHFINGPIMADLDGDGKLEIAVLTNTMAVRAFRGTGRTVGLNPSRAKGLPNRECVNFTGHGIVSMPPILDPPSAGDLNGDGRAELLVGSHTKSWKSQPYGRYGIDTSVCPAPIASTDYVNAMKYTGSRPALTGWPVGISYPGAIPAYGPGTAAIGDIDGDGRPEVVSGSGICGKWDWTLAETPGAYRCFTVNAYDRFGTRLPGFPKATPGPGSINTVTPALGDLAGDGRKEIVWIDWYGNLLVWDVPGAPAPEAMQWPMFRHDPAHTGALVANP